MTPSPSSRPRRVVGVGAGISGLTAAWRVYQRGGDAVSVTVLEGRDRAGGNVRTEHHGDWLIDGGPDSWAAFKPQASALCRDLGLGDDLIGTRPENRKVYIVHRGKLITLPEGLMMGVPTDFVAFARSPLVSWPSKFRMAIEAVLPRRTDGADESLGALVTRRLGREAAVAIAGPLLGGIYAGDVDRLSARSTFPQFVDMERQYGSLLRGALVARRARPVATPAPSMFASLRGGLGSLIDALVQRLPQGALRLSCPVRAISPLGADDTAGRWRVCLAAGEELLADDVILALPAWASGALLSDVASDAAAALRAIPYGSAATVFFGYRRADVDHPLDGTGFVVPRREGLRIMAASWVTSKWAHRGPEGGVLLRGFLGGIGRDSVVTSSDDQLLAAAAEDLRRLMHLRAVPDFHRVFRFARTSPQLEVGHVDRVARIRAAQATLPGLHLISNAYDGVGIPDVVRLAGELATRIVPA